MIGENVMKSVKCYTILGIAIFSIILSGCSAPKKAYLPPVEEKNEELYKNEGAHFELPYEFWLVAGELDMKEGPAYYGAYFHKVGSEYFHSRNGYNYLRLPDEKFDYRSFGAPIVKQLASGGLDEMIRAFPDDTRYPEIKTKLDAGESERFYMMSEEEMPLHRGRLFMNFAGNRMERMSKDKYDYEVDLNTWAGPVNLKMNSKTDPMIMDKSYPIAIGDGMMQGIAFHSLDSSGTITIQGKEQAVTGSSMLVHLFGQPGAIGSGRNEMFLLKMSNNDVLFVSAYHDKAGELVNMNAYYLPADGKMENKFPLFTDVVSNWNSELTRVEYPVEWKVQSDIVQGTVKLLYTDNEVMIEQGVGGFLIGPCEFNGKLGSGFMAPILKGKGVCRVTGYNAAKEILEKQTQNDNQDEKEGTE